MRSDFGTVDPLPSGRWRARVRIGGQRRSLGTYATEQEAWDAIEAALGRLQEGHVQADASDSLRAHGAMVLARGHIPSAS